MAITSTVGKIRTSTGSIRVPLLIIQDVNLGTAVAGIKGMIATGEGTTLWNQVMAAMLLTLIPPVVIVLAMQRAFVRGLVDSEK